MGRTHIAQEPNNSMKVIHTIIVSPHKIMGQENSSTRVTMLQPHFGAKCENVIHIPESGKMKSSRTPKNSELDLRAQFSSQSSVLSLIGKFLKFKCPKWPCMSHFDICSPSYGQKKGKESNWQFDSRPLKVGN
jgi:hypothetical protein